MQLLISALLEVAFVR